MRVSGERAKGERNGEEEGDRNEKRVEEGRAERFLSKGNAGGINREGNEGREQGGKQTSQFSYKDKLLSLGDSGFLEINVANAEAHTGWKNYFTKMSEKNPIEGESDSDEQEEEEEGIDSWCRTGKLPKLKISADEYSAWCKPYMNSLIVKLLGKTLNAGFMKARMERMWGPKNPMRITPLNNGYFIVSFSSHEDRDYALQEGPWMIADHYLLVQRWRPNFNPWKADYQKRIAVWVRIPDLPGELYNVESLRRIGNMVGRTLKVDRTTTLSDKGSFARICVEIDLQKPLLPGFEHFGEERRFEYEGLHLVCFSCGKYGHNEEVKMPTTAVGGAEKVNEMPAAGSNNDQGVALVPRMLVRHTFKKSDIRTESKEPSLTKAAKSMSKKQGEGTLDKGRRSDRQTEKKMESRSAVAGNRDEERIFGREMNNFDTGKEWVQVGNKRKATNKRRARGKENKRDANKENSAREVVSVENKAQILNVASNPFVVLKMCPHWDESGFMDGLEIGH